MYLAWIVLKITFARFKRILKLALTRQTLIKAVGLSMLQDFNTSVAIFLHLGFLALRKMHFYADFILASEVSEGRLVI